MIGIFDKYINFEKLIGIARNRIFVVISFFLFLFIIVFLKLIMMMCFNQKGFNTSSNVNIPIVVSRADLLDRNNVIIATSLPTVSLYACPHEIIDINEAVNKLCNVFSDINKDKLKIKLLSKRKFFWVKRHLTPVQQQKVLNQGIPGVRFVKTEKRVYPDKNLCSHIVGGTDIDNVGIAGIEKVFDNDLSVSVNSFILSIDTKIQYAAMDELYAGLKEFSAKAGVAIVMDIATGEIISLVSLPDFDPNKNDNPNAKEKFNLATLSVMEPGSSAKIFNTAMALEHGISPFKLFDARVPLKIGRFTVHDYKGKKTFLNVEEILKYSSNIGSAKIALEVGIENQKKFYKKIGMLDPVFCELLESQKPLYPKSWGEASAITISYGHGIALSPLHMITIFCGILNDGLLNKPTLIKRDIQLPPHKIVSTRTSKIISSLLRINVLEGTNKLAEVSGYFVGGKTGTSEKQKNGKYSKNANYTVFIGAFPMQHPKYAIYIGFDEPKSTPKTHGYTTAGWNAAPIFSKILKRIGPMLGVLYSNTQEPDWREIIKQDMKKSGSKNEE